MNLTDNDLAQLPVGGQFQAKDGNATATVTKTDKGYNITANCDSLLFLITDLKTEVYHLNKEKMELKDHLNEQKVIEVNRLNGWQYFQIYGFRILAAFLLIFYLYKKYKPKFFNK